MTKLAHQAHNPWTLALTRLISAMPLTIAPALTSARACNIEIEASLWENTAACQLPSDFMQRVSDLSPHDQATAKCIDLKQGQVCSSRLRRSEISVASDHSASLFVIGRTRTR